MSNPYVSLAAAITLGVSAPAFATAAPAAAPRAGAPAAQTVSRAQVIKGRDDAFKKIDSNGDGSISAAELAAADAAIGRGRLDAEFNKLDTNKDGQINKAEFMAAAPPASALVPGMSKTIAALDKNKDGKVTADEFRTPQLAMFDRLDTNKDGVLSMTERQAGQAQRKR